MEEIEKVKENFDKYNEIIDQLVNIGADVVSIILGMLNRLKKENEKIRGFTPYKEKLDRVIKQIKNIKKHPRLKDKYKIIYRHALVSIVSNFESFMNSLFKELINNYPDKIKWPEKKKIGIELSMLSYTTPSIGDLIVKSLRGEINFQDLQSTLRFLQSYLGIYIDLKEDKDKIILYQAIRHIIIHNSGVIDHDFLRQIKNTTFASQYKINEEIDIDKEKYEEAKKVFSKFANLVMKELKQKLSEE